MMCDEAGESSEEFSKSNQSSSCKEVPVDPLDTITSLKDEEEYWLDFFYYCLDLAAANILHIVSTKEAELLNTIDEQVVLEIISKAINFYKSDPAFDNRLLINLLMKIKNCQSVF